MEITFNQATGTIDITIPREQVVDELLGVLPEPTAASDGCLTWSIRFGDAIRAPGTSSSSTGAVGDELLGTGVGAFVGATPYEGRTSSAEAEGNIRGTLILTLNNSVIAEEPAYTTVETISTSASLETLQRLQDEFASELSAIDGYHSTGSINRPQTAFLTALNPTPALVLLFANPFS
jgi:hypothetical protein